MKKQNFGFVTAVLCRAFAMLFLLAGAALPLHAAGLALSQGSITNTYAGTLTLTISGLDSAGESVVIREYLDVNANGVIDAGDLLLRQYTVTDGQVTSIGGQRNLNVPGDDDGAANGTITTHFTYVGSGDIIHLVDGVHIFQVSPGGTGFAPVTANLTVTQQTYSGSGVSGQVMGSGVAQPHAIVVLQTTGSNGSSVAMTLANASGNFALAAAPGTYQILPSKSGFVYDLGTAPIVTVPSGSFLTGQTQTLTPGSRTISGQARNATTLAGVPALAFEAQSATGWTSITLTDGNGNFVSDATSEKWQLGGDEYSVATFGLIRSKVSASAAASNVTGFNINMPQATALLYGSLKTPAPANSPVAFFGIGVNGQSTGYKSKTVTDANGDYTLNVVPDSWNYFADNTSANYIIEQPNVTVSTAGTATLQNLIAYPINAQLSGTVKDQNGNPVANASIGASAPDPANPSGNSLNASATADANGNFDIGVFGGTVASPVVWNLYLQTNGSGTPAYISGNPSYNVVDGVNQTGLTFTLYSVTTQLTGTVKDQNGNPVANASIGASAPDPANPSGNSLNASATADANGNFDLGVFGGTVASPVVWNLYLQTNGSGTPAYISGNPSYNVADGVNQTGLTFTVYSVTTHLTGTLKDQNGNPIGNLSIGANTPDPANPSGQYLNVNATADANGSFDLGVFGGTITAPVVWSLFLQHNGSGTLGYISGSPAYNVVDGVNQTGLIFTLYPVTAHLTGQVLDENNNPIGNIGINAWLGTSSGVQSNANVDGGGNFDLPVYGGTWNLGLSNFDGLSILPQNYAIKVVDNVNQGSLVFRAIHITATISGTVKGPGGVTISGVQVFGSVTSGGNRYMSPAYSQVYTDGSGYYSFPAFASATPWDVGVESLSIGSQGFQPVTDQFVVVGADSNYTVNFVATTLTDYTVTPSAGTNGGVSPNTPQSVGSGEFITFTATPNAGYVVNQWSVDASAVQTGGGQFTMNNVNASHNVLVTFEVGTVQTYALNPFTDGNGAISPNIAPVVSSGGNATFTATPNAGYAVNQWTVDGNVAQIGGSSFTISNITDNHQVGVSFNGTGTPQSWRQAWYNTTANSGDAADTADPYHRGISNLAVLAFFGPGQNPGSAQVSQLPSPQRSGDTLVYNFTQPTGVSGVTYGAQYATSLNPINWQPVGDTGSGNRHIFSVSIGTNTQLFLRLTVIEQ